MPGGTAPPVLVVPSRHPRGFRVLFWGFDLRSNSRPTFSRPTALVNRGEPACVRNDGKRALCVEVRQHMKAARTTGAGRSLKPAGSTGYADSPGSDLTGPDVFIQCAYRSHPVGRPVRDGFRLTSSGRVGSRRAHSSVWLERVPDKDEVPGSSPGAPTLGGLPRFAGSRQFSPNLKGCLRFCRFLANRGGHWLHRILHRVHRIAQLRQLAT